MPQQISHTLEMHARVDQQTARRAAQVVEGQGRQAGGLAELPESPSDVAVALRGGLGGQETRGPAKDPLRAFGGTVLRINHRLEKQWERMSDQVGGQIERVTDLFDRD
jgi:hypothetical protein